MQFGTNIVFNKVRSTTVMMFIFREMSLASEAAKLKKILDGEREHCKKTTGELVSSYLQ